MFPIGGSGASAESFFEGYLSFPILIVCYFGHKIYTRDWRLFVKLEDMDLDTGRKQVDLNLRREEMKIEQETLAKRSFMTRFLSVWC